MSRKIMEEIKKCNVFELYREPDENGNMLVNIHPIGFYFSQLNNADMKKIEYIFYQGLLNQKKIHDKKEVNNLMDTLIPAIATAIVQESEYEATQLISNFQDIIAQTIYNYETDLTKNTKDLKNYKKFEKTFFFLKDDISKISFLLQYYIEAYHADIEANQNLDVVMKNYAEELGIILKYIQKIPEVYIKKSIVLLKKSIKG